MKWSSTVVIALASAAVLAACGGEEQTAETVTVTTPAATSTSESAAALTPVDGPPSAAKIAACLEDAGAEVTARNKPLGVGARGTFAVLPNGTFASAGVASNAAVAKAVVRELAKEPGYEVNTTKEPRVFVLFDGDVDDEDRALMAECASPE